jgi:hypothetical protein
MIRHRSTGKTCHAKVAGARLRARFERAAQRASATFATLTDPTARVRES